MSLPTVAAYASSPLVFRLNEAVPVLVLSAELDFESLREQLRFRLPEHLTAIPDRALRVDLLHRDIRLLDLRRLSNFLREEFSIELTGLYVRSAVLQKFAERELKFRLFLNDPTATPPGPTAKTNESGPLPLAPEVVPQVSPTASVLTLVEATPMADDVNVADPFTLASASERKDPTNLPALGPSISVNTDFSSIDLTLLPPRTEGTPEFGRRNTLTVHRTLRSGGSIRHDGDVYLFGDVNPGAQVSASGNIVVLGALKGMAHAGHSGDESAFILGLDFRPTQVRIGRRIAVAPTRADGRPSDPEIAHILDGQIVIESYRSRSR